LFICENGGRMTRRRILARGMVRQIISAAGRKHYRASHRWTDGLASIGFLCCGIRSTRVETAVLFRDLDLGSSEALACRPGMINPSISITPASSLTSANDRWDVLPMEGSGMILFFLSWDVVPIRAARKTKQPPISMGFPRRLTINSEL
jgi:hypothetical protein